MLGATAAADAASAGRHRQDAPVAAGGGRVLDDFPDGVWFVELAPVADRSARAAGGRRGAGRQGRSRAPVLEALRHASSATASCCWCSTTASTWSRLAPSCVEHCCAPVRAEVLATSRERLRIAGETMYACRRLPFPIRDRLIARRAGATTKRCGCSCERASAAQPAFHGRPNRTLPRVRRDLPPARWHPAGARACGRACARAVGRADRRAPGRSFSAA